MPQGKKTSHEELDFKVMLHMANICHSLLSTSHPATHPLGPACLIR